MDGWGRCSELNPDVPFRRWPCIVSMDRLHGKEPVTFDIVQTQVRRVLMLVCEEICRSGSIWVSYLGLRWF